MRARLPKQNQGGAQNMNAMIRQAQKMQDEISALQEDIEGREFTATAGGGVVTAVVSGKKTLLSLEIKPELVNGEDSDIEMLQDLIIVAVNEGLRQIDEISNSEMGKLTGGLNIPGL